MYLHYYDYYHLLLLLFYIHFLIVHSGQDRLTFTLMYIFNITREPKNPIV